MTALAQPLTAPVAPCRPRPSYAEIRRRIAARDARAAELAAQGWPAVAFRDRDRPEVSYLAHRDSYPGGRWRVTRFGPDLEPWGHDVAPTLADAIRAAAVDGADLATATPILPAVAVNPQ